MSGCRRPARALAAISGLAALVAGLPATAEPHLVAVGDSLTAGGDWLAYVGALAPGWSWEEHGLAGEDSWDAADGIHCSPSPQQCSVSQSTGRFRALLAGRTRSPEDIVVLLWGTNDVRQPCWADDNPGGPDDCRGFTRDALAQMTDDAVAEGYPVVIGIPPPIVDAPHSPHSPGELATFDGHLQLLRDMVEEIASARASFLVRSADAYGHFQGLPGWVSADYYLLPNGFSDGIHPGTEPGPSGASGRFHLAEPLVSGAAAAAPAPVPALGVPGLLLLGVAILGFSRLPGVRSEIRPTGRPRRGPGRRRRG